MPHNRHSVWVGVLPSSLKAFSRNSQSRLLSYMSLPSEQPGVPQGSNPEQSWPGMRGNPGRTPAGTGNRISCGAKQPGSPLPGCAPFSKLSPPEPLDLLWGSGICIYHPLGCPRRVKCSHRFGSAVYRPGPPMRVLSHAAWPGQQPCPAIQPLQTPAILMAGGPGNTAPTPMSAGGETEARGPIIRRTDRRRVLGKSRGLRQRASSPIRLPPSTPARWKPCPRPARPPASDRGGTHWSRSGTWRRRRAPRHLTPGSGTRFCPLPATSGSPGLPGHSAVRGGCPRAEPAKRFTCEGGQRLH